MPVSRLLAATIGLLLPVAMAGTVQAAPHKHHPAAHVRTATYKVNAPGKSNHRLRASSATRHHVAQAARHRSTRKG